MIAKDSKSSSRAALVCAAAAGVGVALPAPWSVVVLVALTLGWVASRPERRRLVTVGVAFALAVAVGVAEIGRSRPRSEDPATAPSVGESLLQGLDREAEASAALLSPVGSGAEASRVAFRALEERARTVGRPNWTWQLVDPDGVPVAWSGRGLVHELTPEQLPGSGRVRQAGYTSETRAAVHPLSDSADGWRVLVGSTLEAAPRNRLAADEPRADDGGRTAGLAGLALIFLGLFELAASRGGGWVALVFAGAVLALGQAAALSAWVVGGLVASIAVLFVIRPRLVVASRSAAVIYGLGLTLALLASAWILQEGLGPVDLGSRFVGELPEVLLRLALFLVALGLLPAREEAWGAGASRKLSLFAFGALLLGSALHALPALGVILLGAGAVAVALEGRRSLDFDLRQVLLAGLLAAISWEIVFHGALENRIERAVTVDLAPPTATELETMAGDLESYFEAAGWQQFVDVAGPRRVGDLAFAVWRESPLADGSGLSSLSIESRGEVVSVFSYGLPVSERGGLDEVRALREALLLPAWDNAVIEGTAPVRFGAREEGLARYWYVPRPGFRSAGGLMDGVAAGLLRGGQELASIRRLLPRGVYFGFYDADGLVRVPPWKGAGRLSLAPSGELPHSVETPDGSAEVFAARSDGGWRAVFLPAPSLLGGFERIATHALSPLLVLLVLVVLSTLLRARRGVVRRAIDDALGSYSRRMLLLTTGLLVVPVLLLSAFLLRMVGERIQKEQVTTGEAAVESAQRILGDYVLTLEPGFGIETTLDDELLIWLSGAVHHEVNLYWGSQLYASSKRELFSAGILPARIPGEIYSRLALDGSGLASRNSTAQGSEYREFYAPLAVPGVRADEIQLFLSMPLLAQEEEAAAELVTLRRRVLIVAIATALLLMAFGRRFVRTFTEPLMEIVQGTQRIAGGAPALGYKPKDRELANLGEAIDRMAARIAETRSSLLREKEIVDRIVDNITAGVVSVDREGNVILLNRTANELLGLEAGGPLLAALEAREELDSVASFVRESGGELRQATVRLGRTPGEVGEWSLVWVPVERSGEASALFVIEDVTEVLRAQRLEAWAEMARIIAHEVKNPLTPIRLSAEHLREVYRTRPEEIDSIFERCTSNILTQVEELGHIAADFSTYSRIPEIKREPGDLAQAVRELVDTYHSSAPLGIAVALEVEGGPTEAHFDARLIARAIRNLIENALRASPEGGAVRVLVTGSQAAPGNGFVEVRVEDDGPGVEPDLLARIFEPYFSTEEHGTGLGLAIARRIAEEHGGRIQARNRPEGGLSVNLVLPHATAPSD